MACSPEEEGGPSSSFSAPPSPSNGSSTDDGASTNTHFVSATHRRDDSLCLLSRSLNSSSTFQQRSAPTAANDACPSSSLAAVGRRQAQTPSTRGGRMMMRSPGTSLSQHPESYADTRDQPRRRGRRGAADGGARLCAGCGQMKPHVARGLCRNCYQKWYSRQKTAAAANTLVKGTQVHEIPCPSASESSKNNVSNSDTRSFSRKNSEDDFPSDKLISGTLSRPRSATGRACGYSSAQSLSAGPARRGRATRRDGRGLNEFEGNPRDLEDCPGSSGRGLWKGSNSGASGSVCSRKQLSLRDMNWGEKNSPSEESGKVSRLFACWTEHRRDRANIRTPEIAEENKHSCGMEEKIGQAAARSNWKRAEGLSTLRGEAVNSENELVAFEVLGIPSPLSEGDFDEVVVSDGSVDGTSTDLICHGGGALSNSEGESVTEIGEALSVHESEEESVTEIGEALSVHESEDECHEEEIISVEELEGSLSSDDVEPPADGGTENTHRNGGNHRDGVLQKFKRLFQRGAVRSETAPSLTEEDSFQKDVEEDEGLVEIAECLGPAICHRASSGVYSWKTVDTAEEAGGNDSLPVSPAKRGGVDFLKLDIDEHREVHYEERETELRLQTHGNDIFLKIGIWNIHGGSKSGYGELRKALVANTGNLAAFDVAMLQEVKWTDNQVCGRHLADWSCPGKAFMFRSTGQEAGILWDRETVECRPVTREDLRKAQEIAILDEEFWASMTDYCKDSCKIRRTATDRVLYFRSYFAIVTLARRDRKARTPPRSRDHHSWKVSPNGTPPEKGEHGGKNSPPKSQPRGWRKLRSSELPDFVSFIMISFHNVKTNKNNSVFARRDAAVLLHCAAILQDMVSLDEVRGMSAALQVPCVVGGDFNCNMMDVIDDPGIAGDQWIIPAYTPSKRRTRNQLIDFACVRQAKYTPRALGIERVAVRLSGLNALQLTVAQIRFNGKREALASLAADSRGGCGEERPRAYAIFDRQLDVTADATATLAELRADEDVDECSGDARLMKMSEKTCDHDPLEGALLFEVLRWE